MSILKRTYHPINPVTSDVNVQTFSSLNFVTGDSPALLDVNTVLGRNGTEFSIINDGAGPFLVATSNDGVTFGSDYELKVGEVYSFKDLSVDTIRLIWISDSSYRMTVI